VEHAPAGDTRGATHGSPPPLTLKGLLNPEPVIPLLASDLPAALQGFAEAASRLETTSRILQKEYQRFIQGVVALENSESAGSSGDACGTPEIAAAYHAVRDAWEAYRRGAREVRDRYRGLEAYHAAGYGAVLTPDLEVRLDTAVSLYARIRDEHIEWRALMNQQVVPEGERLGCGRIEVPSVPDLTLVEASTPGEGDARSEGEGAPVSGEDVRSSGETEPVPLAAQGGDQRSAGPDLTLDGTSAGGEQAEAAPRPEVTVSSSESSGASAEGVTAEEGRATPTPVLEGVLVRFAVDNSACTEPVIVFLDGQRLGTVPGEASAEFEALEGRHVLCLAPAGEASTCSDPSRQIEIMLYEGFALRPGC